MIASREYLTLGIVNERICLPATEQVTVEVTTRNCVHRHCIEKSFCFTFSQCVPAKDMLASRNMPTSSHPFQ